MGVSRVDEDVEGEGLRDLRRHHLRRRHRARVLLHPDGTVPRVREDRRGTGEHAAGDDHRAGGGDLRDGVPALGLPQEVRDAKDARHRRDRLADPLHHLRDRDAALAGDRVAGAARLLLRVLLRRGVHLRR